MEMHLYNSLLTVYSALREGHLDNVGLSEYNLKRMEAEINMILETHAPLTYDPDTQGTMEINDSWADFEDDGQPSELTEWTDYDPDC